MIICSLLNLFCVRKSTFGWDYYSIMDLVLRERRFFVDFLFILHSWIYGADLGIKK